MQACGREHLHELLNRASGGVVHGFHWVKWTTGKPIERLQLIPAGQEHILQQQDGKPR